MRVMNTSILLCAVLLALCLSATMAGAIYIPGQEIPNDGLYHILSAGDGSGSTGTAPAPGDIGLPPAIPSELFSLDDLGLARFAGVPDDFGMGGIGSSFAMPLITGLMPAVSPSTADPSGIYLAGTPIFDETSLFS